jgi:peptidyl-prolyl cis-trans isomerase B (cyclophilin B)
MSRSRLRSTLPPILVLALAGLLTAGCVSRLSSTVLSTVGESAPPVGASSGGSAATGSCPTSQPPALAAGNTASVTLTTPKGAIVIKVDGALGPNAAGNFVALVRCGYYDGVVFHRLVPGFVIQGGDGQYGREPKIDPRVGQGGPGYKFADDPVATAYTRGVVAMANSGPDTNGSQFFIILGDIRLDPNYSVFGTVTTGMDVVDAIAAMPNGGGRDNRALEPVPITKASVNP